MLSPTPTFGETLIPAAGVRSLVWSGDTLIDWAAGGAMYHLDGSCTRAHVAYSYPFDAATTAPGSDHVVIYKTLGTKGLLLRNGQIVRELNRSFYHASIYEYPVCLARHGGRTLLIHCPEDHNRLEIEDAETGEKLTLRASEPADIFHSRLRPSPDGGRLLSAGWAWAPSDVVLLFDLAEALRRPEHLNENTQCVPDSPPYGLTEDSSACWQTDTTVVLAGARDDVNEVIEPASGIVVYDVLSNAFHSAHTLESPPGTLLPIGSTHVVAFHEHPRLIRLADGAVEHTWSRIASGAQIGSILGTDLPPILALDPDSARFAIVQPDGIHVVALER
jgi:hypothetical protein